MKRMLSIALLSILCHCESLPKDQRRNHVSFYSDFDVIKFEGKEPIVGNKPVPPCFEIDSIDPKKKILTFWISKKIKYSRTYSRIDDYWSSKFILNADTIDLIAYDFIGKNRCITLEYDSVKNNLKMASDWKDSIESIYTFNNGLTLNPSGGIDLGGKVFDKWIAGKGIIAYHMKNNRLQLISTAIRKSPDNIAIDTSYYDIGSHSIFWWANLQK